MQQCGPTSERADIWRNRAGLGKSRRETWLALNDGAMTIEQLAKRTGFTEATVRNHLVRFNQLGMARPLDEHMRGPWEPTDVNWAAVERYLEVDGYMDRQVARHRSESEAHRRYVNGGGGAWAARPSRDRKRK